MRLFHVTVKNRLDRILREGLRPDRSEGAEQRVWLCDAPSIGWAFGHVAEHKGVKVKDLVLLVTEVPEQDLSQFRPGVYVTYKPVPFVARVK